MVGGLELFISSADQIETFVESKSEKINETEEARINLISTLKTE